MKGAGIGLIGLLLVAAIIFWISFGGKDQGGGYVRSELETRANETQIVQGMSGKDSQGEIVTKSIAFAASNKGILVNTVKPGGAFDTKYGLKPNDVILEIGPLVTKDQAADNGTADAYLRDAYARGEELVVQRGPQRITLPLPAVPVPAAGAVRANTAQGQALDLVHQIETH